MYYYPNRPLLATVSHLVNLEAGNTVAEIKKNGDRLVLLKTGRSFEFWNRHKQVLKRYEPSEEVLDALNALRIPTGTQLDGELLHNHTKHIKHLIYLYDVYVWKGEEVRDTLFDRRKRLEDMFDCLPLHHEESVVLAKQYRADFRGLFDRVIKKEENEGLVVKNLRGKITFNTVASPDVYWQVKVRRPAKNYSF